MVGGPLGSAEGRSPGPFLTSAPPGSPARRRAWPPADVGGRRPALRPAVPAHEVQKRLDSLRRAFPFVPGGAQDVVSLVPDSKPLKELFERLAASEPRPRPDLSGRLNVSGGSGGQLGRFIEIGGDFLKANLDRRYTSAAEALGEELEAERRRRRLGIYPPERLWFTSRGSDGAFWTCSLTPRLETLRERFNREYGAGGVESGWQLYLEAFRTTLAAASGAGVLLDWNPNNFGVDAGRVFYIDDDVVDLRKGSAAFVSQALLRLREYAETPLERKVGFLEGFAGLLAEIGSRDLVLWGLLGDLESRHFWPRERDLVAILERLVRRLDKSARK